MRNRQKTIDRLARETSVDDSVDAIEQREKAIRMCIIEQRLADINSNVENHWHALYREMENINHREWRKRRRERKEAA
jgi:hypothetical protein